MKRARFSKQDWLDHGSKQLSALGPEALKLDAICASAGRTKGSFYHHFADHSLFLTELVARWVETQTTAVMERVPGDMDAREKDLLLTEIALEIDYRLEIGVRELARRHPELAGDVAAADDMRLNFMAELYCDLFGITREDALFAAHIEYAAFVGNILVYPSMAKPEQQALAGRFRDMMRTCFDAEKRNA